MADFRFSLNDRDGVLRVEYAANASLERSGFDMFDAGDFDPALAIGHPTLHARVEHYEGSGYRTATAFIQWVNTERTTEGEVRRERELDVPETFRAAGVPFFAWGYPASLYDAPANNRNGADRLVWQATTWFVSVPARWNDYQVQPIIGFQWGYVDDGTMVKLLPFEALDRDHWSQHHAWLGQSAPGFQFAR